MGNPTYRYIFEDTLTGLKLATIPMYGVSMKRYMSTWGQASTYGVFQGTFRADTPGFQVRELLSATIPGRTNIWVERNGVLVWGGLVTTRTYQSESYTYSINASAFDWFMTGQFLTFDSAPSADDPRNLIVNLWNSVQSVAATNLRIVTPPDVTPQSPQYTSSWTGTDYSSYADTITAAVQAGAEYRLDYAYSSTGVRTCSMVLGRWDVPSLQLGSSESSSSVTLYFPGSISNYWISENGQQGATQVLGIGQANAASTVRNVFTNTSFTSQGWPQFGIKFNLTNISDQTTLDNILQNNMKQFQPPFEVPTYKLNGSNAFGQFNLGDYVKIVVKDKWRFPDGPFVQNIRVVGVTLTPATNTTIEQCDFVVDQPSITG